MRERGVSTPQILVLAALTLILLLGGCAKAPRRPPEPAVSPPPKPSLTPQEAALERALRDFYKAPYRSGGITPAGVDCSGLVMGVYQRLGLALPRTAADQFTAGQPVPLGRLRFGDVVFFNRYCQVKKSGPYLAHILPSAEMAEICHNGIYLGNGLFMHASSQGVEVSRLDAEVWKNSFVGARRYLLGNSAAGP
ncbi:MAG: C40 family peptidase [Desulfobaccales bacterium]